MTCLQAASVHTVASRPIRHNLLAQCHGAIRKKENIIIYMFQIQNKRQMVYWLLEAIFLVCRMVSGSNPPEKEKRGMGG